MSGTVLENLSGRKISVVVAILLVSQVVCFLVGGLVAPVPASHQNVLGSVCRDLPGPKNDSTVWLYTRGEGRCDVVSQEEIEAHEVKMANQLAFVFQMPLPRGGRVLDFSRWQQNLMGVLQVDVAFEGSEDMDVHTELTLEARLAYRNKEDSLNGWKLYAESLETRSLDCAAVHMTSSEVLYSCDAIPLFELGALHHDYYLLNLRLPIDSELKMNTDIGHVHDLQLTTIYQNGGFTKTWVGLKTVFFPFILGALIWFWRRVHLLQRSPALLEYMLINLGLALTLLNLPLEYLTLAVEMRFMLLLSDIRQGVFYATLLSFWLIFTGEHMLIQEVGDRSTLKAYWKHLSAVIIGCLSLFVFDMCERGTQLRNPFYTIWTSHLGSNLAMGFIVIAALSAGVYFLFLCGMVWKVFRNISLKKTALPAMSSARRLHYEGVIYRFKFLMLATVVCAALTVAGFEMDQFEEGRHQWSETLELQVTSAIQTGIYGMWNIYIFALLFLYAPSHKQWSKDSSAQVNIISEEIEINTLTAETNSMTSEVSSLTSFVRKTAFD